MVMLAACGGHAANVADRTSTTVPAAKVTTLDLDSSRDAAEPSTKGFTDSTDATETSAQVTTATTVTSTSVPASNQRSDDADVALARQAVLANADLPGWTADDAAPAADPSTGSLPGGCRYLSAFRGRASETGHAAATFLAPDATTELSNTVIVHTDVDGASAAFAVVDRRETIACLESLLVGDGGPFAIEQATVTRRALARVDEGVEFDARLSVIVDGATYSFMARFTYRRVGRAISQGIAFGDDRVPTESEAALDAVARRLDAAV